MCVGDCGELIQKNKNNICSKCSFKKYKPNEGKQEKHTEKEKTKKRNREEEKQLESEDRNLALLLAAPLATRSTAKTGKEIEEEQCYEMKNMMDIEIFNRKRDLDEKEEQLKRMKRTRIEM